MPAKYPIPVHMHTHLHQRGVLGSWISELGAWSLELGAWVNRLTRLWEKQGLLVCLLACLLT